MRFDILTLFPEMFNGPLTESIVKRAIQAGLISVELHDIRAHATDKHHTTDDAPYGGGAGMVMKAEPLSAAIREVVSSPLPVVHGEPQSSTDEEQRTMDNGQRTLVVLMTPAGEPFTQRVAEELASYERLVLVCGRYEGVDERVREALVDRELSIGDYVLTGGELAALVIVDAVARFVPGVVGDEQSVMADSFSRGLLDFPQYTRPAEVSTPSRVLKVPDVLLSGNHGEIRRWRKREALSRTLDRRPDLLADAALDDEERAILKELRHERN
jgi:tRNA (guanine37-N1)-methyltransferase